MRPNHHRLAYTLTGIATAGITFAWLTGAAAAQALVPPIIPNDSTATVAPWVYSLIAGLATPLLTGLIMKVTAHSALTAVINAVLVAISAVVGQIVLGSGTLPVQNTLVMAVSIFVVNVATFFGLWKPTVGANFSAVSPAVANAGIGPSTSNVPPTDRSVV